MPISLTRRAALAGMSAMAARPALAARAITLMHGFLPGANIDLVARLVAEHLAPRLGQPIVVEPRPGAGGTIAAASLARSAPDGATIAVLPGGHAAAAAVYKTLPYDAVADFTFVGMLSEFPFILATYPDHPAQTLVDLIRSARAAPGVLTYATPGIGTGQHLACALFAAMAGIKIQHVPYRGALPAVADLLAKRIDFQVDTPAALMPLIQAGALRPIAITGADRFFLRPDIPPVGDAVSGYAATSWLGVAGPARLPHGFTDRLNGELRAILAEPAVAMRLRDLGSDARPTTPAGFRQRVAADVAKWTRLAAEAKIPRV